MQTKKELRRYYKEKRNDLTANEITQKSALVAEWLYGLEAYRRAEHILFYVSAASEVNTHAMIKSAVEAGKKVYIPLTYPENRTMDASRLKNFESELKLGSYHILEPAAEFVRICSPDLLDLIIVPGLAFDRQGYRLGYGAGYYDKFLAHVRPDALKIGLAYDFQVCGLLPHDRLDIPCDGIVTPTGVVMFERQK